MIIIIIVMLFYISKHTLKSWVGDFFQERVFTDLLEILLMSQKVLKKMEQSVMLGPSNPEKHYPIVLTVVKTIDLSVYQSITMLNVAVCFFFQNAASSSWFGDIAWSTFKAGMSHDF